MTLQHICRGSVVQLERRSASGELTGQTYARVLRIGKDRAWIDVDVCGVAHRLVLWLSGLHCGAEPTVLMHGGRYFVEIGLRRESEARDGR